MVDVTQGPITIVTGEDPVAAGMLALDLVQNGVNAHAVADIWSAMEELSAGHSARPVLVTGYSSLQRTLEAWRSVRSEGHDVAHVAVVELAEYPAAEAAASAAEWLGVVPRPVHVPSLVGIITGDDVTEGPEETGPLEQGGLATLLERALFAARRDAAYADNTIHLKRSDRSGMVVIRGGELVHAEAGDDNGRHALERMFCWGDGSWRMTWSAQPGPQTLTGSWRALMSGAHEYARRVEEAQRSMSLLNEVVQVRWERVRPLPVVAEALFRRLARGMTVHQALAGEGDDELEVYAALQSRIRRGAVESVSVTRQRQSSGFEPVPLPVGAPPLPKESSPSGEMNSGQGGSTSRGRKVTWTSPQTLPFAEERATGNVPIQARMGAPAAPASVDQGAPPRSPVLPSALPEVDSDTFPPMPPPPAERSLSARTTGWFGLQVGAEASAPVTLTQQQDQVVLPAAAPVEGPVGTTTHVVADLPRPQDDQPSAASVESHFALFSEGMDAPVSSHRTVDVDFDDLLRPRRRTIWSRRPKRSSRWARSCWR